MRQIEGLRAHLAAIDREERRLQQMNRRWRQQVGDWLLEGLGECARHMQAWSLAGLERYGEATDLLVSLASSDSVLAEAALEELPPFFVETGRLDEGRALFEAAGRADLVGRLRER